MRVTFDEQPSDQDLQHFGVKGMKWAAVGATVAHRVTSQIAEDNYIKNYLLDHPNTKLNRDGILKTRGLE